MTPDVRFVKATVHFKVVHDRDGALAAMPPGKACKRYSQSTGLLSGVCRNSVGFAGPDTVVFDDG